MTPFALNETTDELDQKDDISGAALYSTEVKHIPYLTPEERDTYIEAARTGDLQARNELITRVPGPVISGSGCGKNNPSAKPCPRIESPKSLLNFCAMSRESSRCCFWSSPTGTWVAR